jgi:hypothetical protein
MLGPEARSQVFLTRDRVQAPPECLVWRARFLRNRGGRALVKLCCLLRWFASFPFRPCASAFVSSNPFAMSTSAIRFYNKWLRGVCDVGLAATHIAQRVDPSLHLFISELQVRTLLLKTSHNVVHVPLIDGDKPIRRYVAQTDAFRSWSEISVRDEWLTNRGGNLVVTQNPAAVNAR